MRSVSVHLRALLTVLVGVALLAPTVAACSVADDDATARPAAFVSDVDHKTYCPWVNTPHEVDDGCGSPATRWPAAPFPIPTDEPHREPGMSDGDFLLLGALFGYGLGHHGYYYSPSYWDRSIGPAYIRYPGQVSYGYGHRPMVHIDNSQTYNTTIVQRVDTKYAEQETKAAADPKTGAYKTAGGKPYTGATVPKSSFSGTNVTPRGPAGDAPTSKAGTSPTTPKTNSTTSPTTSGGGKGGYSPPSSGRSGGSSGGKGGK